MADTTITLNVKTDLEDDCRRGLGGNLLTLEVTASNDIDPEIFVFQRDVDSEFSPDNLALFWGVASVAQMHQLPKNSGSVDEPFFRAGILELVFETAAEVEDAIAKIRGDIVKLQKGNDFMLNAKNRSEYTILFDDGVATDQP